MRKGEYSVGGKAHRILRRLSQGPASTADLAETIRGPNQSHKSARERARALLGSLRSDRLVHSQNALTFICPEGQDVLTGLNHGHPYNRDARPQAVRYFEGARA